MITAQNAAAMRRKAEAEKPFYLHKKGEHLHRWDSWDPNMKAMMTQEVIIEMYDECTVVPRAEGKVEVTTTNRRLMSQLDRLHNLKPTKCTGRRMTIGAAVYVVDTEAWANYLAEHTEAEAEDQEGAGAET